MPLLLLGAVVSNCSKGSGASADASCVLNSDCDAPLVCVFSKCHAQCNTSVDCPSGERCVATGDRAGVANVCELTQEAACGAGNVCAGDLVCTPADQQCRTPCVTNGDCRDGQYCVATEGATVCYQINDTVDEATLVDAGALAPDGAVLVAVNPNATLYAPGVGPAGDSGVRDTGTSDGSGQGGPDGTVATSEGGTPSESGAVGNDAGPDSTVVVEQCPSAQTQFGSIAVGDSNASFTSSVGVRTAHQLLVFSGYDGPDPSADAGSDAGNVNLVYWQAFDATTAASLGPAQPLALTDPDSNLGSIYLEDVSIAPTGEIALLYTHLNVQDGVATGLDAAFFGPSADAGGAGPSLVRVAPIETDHVGNPPQINTSNEGQAHAIWEPSSATFVFSYVDITYMTVVVQKFLPDGQVAGGGTNPVPTDVDPRALVSYECGSTAPSGSLLGVAVNPSTGGSDLRLETLNAQGSEVGSGEPLAAAGLNDIAGADGYYWIGLGATARGFVYLVGSAPVQEIFVPVVGGAIAATNDAGAATMLDGGALSGFTVSGTQGAIIGRAVDDDTAGAGGVGVVLQYANGASFLYVNPDGVTHVGPAQVIAHAFNPGDIATITQYGGSFGVSLYSASEHLTRMAASGCVQ